MSRAVAIRSTSRFVVEENVNQWTHGIGFVATLPAGWWLVHSAADRQNEWLTAGCAIFAVSLSLLYAASTLSHSVRRGVWRHRFRTLDQVCIFLLIAGSYSPVGMSMLRDGWNGMLLVGMWLMAATGIVCKVFITRLHNVSTSFYIGMGWVPAFALPDFFRCLGVEGVAWIVAGGAAYSIGTWFLKHDHRPYFHVIWHLLAMLGSACHYTLVLRCVVPAA